MSRLCACSVPIFRIWGAFSEQNDGRKDKVQADVDDDGYPNQDTKALGEIEHENIGANAQLHQRHPV